MIFGPFAIHVRDPETGALTEALHPGAHYTTTRHALAAHGAALAAYVVEPDGPLQHVMAGDDPAAAPWVTGAANPAWNTVPLRFPDEATAAGVIAAVGAGA